MSISDTDYALLVEQRASVIRRLCKSEGLSEKMLAKVTQDQLRYFNAETAYQLACIIRSAVEKLPTDHGYVTMQIALNVNQSEAGTLTERSGKIADIYSTSFKTVRRRIITYSREVARAIDHGNLAVVRRISTVSECNCEAALSAIGSRLKKIEAALS